MMAAPAVSALGRLAEAQQGPAKPTLSPKAATRAGHPFPVDPPIKAKPKPKVTLNVRDNGATGDGKTKDTLAIQLTIERCSVFGGGEVVVPAGDYLTGALALRSGVTLRIEEGATINGSTDMSDYPFAQVRWEGHWVKGYLGFISATDAENIGIGGARGRSSAIPLCGAETSAAPGIAFPR